MKEKIFTYGDNPKEFTNEYFINEIVNKKSKTFSNKKYKIEVLPGKFYYADSKEEIKAIEKLIRMNYIKDITDQGFVITYRHKFKYHEYIPDIIFMDQNNHIVFMEIKQIDDMVETVNIKKYNALARYCNSNGYLYTMCNKSLYTFEDLKKRNVSSSNRNKLYKILDEKGKFTKDDFDELYGNLSHNSKEIIYKDFQTIVINDDLLMKYKGNKITRNYIIKRK